MSSTDINLLQFKKSRLLANYGDFECQHIRNHSIFRRQNVSKDKVDVSSKQYILIM